MATKKAAPKKTAPKKRKSGPTVHTADAAFDYLVRGALVTQADGTLAIDLNGHLVPIETLANLGAEELVVRFKLSKDLLIRTQSPGDVKLLNTIAALQVFLEKRALTGIQSEVTCCNNNNNDDD